ncbi:MAG: trans-acting enoyl reductase family protein [Halioglobus sp.]
MKKREFDIVVWGATGFTGKLVAEYLMEQYGLSGDLTWAIAGRNQDKLEEVRNSLLDGADVEALPIIVADSNDSNSIEALAARSKVICTTVGPYALYGTSLVKACVDAGTDYCDLAGEVQWMAKIIEQYQEAALKSGARIVHTCGFDSIPSDMGTWFLQQSMIEKHGAPAIQVKARIGRTRGAASGGTIASMLNMMDEAKGNEFVQQAMENPYSLYPKDAQPGDDELDQTDARYDADFDQWTAPFVMAAINARVVRRSNALMGFPWSEGFRYDESLLTDSRLIAKGAALATTGGMRSLSFGPFRKLAQRVLPKPGEGPSKSAREAGHYEIFFHGRHAEDSDKSLRARVTGDMDPGYGSTSKMLAESAVCLAKDKPLTGGGIWTPSSAMGQHLLARLQDNAGLTFDIVDA